MTAETIHPHILSRVLRRARTHKLSLGGLQILCAVSDEAPAAAISGEVAKAVGVTKESITNLVDTLEQAGFIRRQRGTIDRRQALLGLTEKGKAALTDILTA